MTVDVRLECLRLAFVRAGANDPRPWRVIAEELYDWAVDLSTTPDAPTPPAAPAPEPERLSGWVNIHPNWVYPTKAAADREAGFDRIACIDLSQHRKGEGLSP